MTSCPRFQPGRAVPICWALRGPAAGLLAAVLSSFPLHAQQFTAEVDPALQAWEGVPGVLECADCHYQPSPLRRQSLAFVRLTEARDWLEYDKHAVARQRIEPLSAADLQLHHQRLAEELGVEQLPDDWLGPSNLLSRAICDALGWDPSTDEGYAAFRDSCLTCHGGYAPGEGREAVFARTGPQQPGIACTYCHGSAEADWVRRHVDRSWRLVPPEEKRQAGMPDLVDPARQAANCFDCHIGNLDEGKFVTHAMYAAGHPPLPGVELETFCESLQSHRTADTEAGASDAPVFPHHWRPLEELADFPEREQYLRVNFPERFGAAPADAPLDPARESWDTRKVLAGALVAKRQALQLARTAAAGPRWGDFALYDCAACHHDLRVPSARQERGYASRYRPQFARPPGRPRLSEWPDTLLDVALAVSGAAGVDRAATIKLEDAIDTTPFGEPGEIGQAAAEAILALDRAVEQLRPVGFDGEATYGVLQQLCRVADDPAGRLTEFHAARQLVWAIQQVSGEVQRLAPERLPPEFLERVARLSQLVPTALPSGRRQFISGSLGEMLDQQQRYAPTPLVAEIRALGQLLEASP